MKLTPRERDVLTALAQCTGDKAAAVAVGMAYSTLQSYKKFLFVKAGVSNRAQLVAVAYERGWLTPGAGGKQTPTAPAR